MKQLFLGVQMITTRLKDYNNYWYKPGGTALTRILWYFINILFIRCHWMPSSAIKVVLLKMFGAKIGSGVVVKPGVSVKYPWRLSVGDNSWIGEDVWIDNLADVEIGKNCCISQGAMLLCGNHDFKKATFDLMIGNITIEDGAWIGAKSVVCPGITAKTHSVLAVGSVASNDLYAYSIYRGNPAVKVKDRLITE